MPGIFDLESRAQGSLELSIVFFLEKRFVLMWIFVILLLWRRNKPFCGISSSKEGAELALTGGLSDEAELALDPLSGTESR